MRKDKNTHPAVRIGTMLLGLLGGLLLVYGGWQKTGEPKGLLQMLAGVAALLVALASYNRPFRG